MSSTPGKTNLAAVDPANGILLWTFSMSYLAENSTTISNGLLLAADETGELYAVTPGGA